MASVFIKALQPLCTRRLSFSAVKWKIFDVASAGQFKSDVLDSKGLVIVDFHAEWCGPCKDLGPVLESVATQESVDLAKVNIDSFTELSMEYGVSAVPTVVAISNGKVVDQFVGGQNKDFVKNFIKKQL
ncbi:LOW QUALITY PROTEIN: thioredoxin, mitochondrial-like [Halichondria panicea]|uniref:LOW QUALITY PROTEIN: thioredoxin, mitochondrial-like n=1 Tax=Halichondria panicea TaxID=6063 RepID=UPI00312BC21D